MNCDSCAHLKSELDGSVRDGVELSKKLDAWENVLNKIHDLAGQIMGPDSHPNLGAIQDWVHTVLPCPEKAVMENPK